MRRNLFQEQRRETERMAVRWATPAAARVGTQADPSHATGGGSVSDGGAVLMNWMLDWSRLGADTRVG